MKPTKKKPAPKKKPGNTPRPRRDGGSPAVRGLVTKGPAVGPGPAEREVARVSGNTAPPALAPVPRPQLPPVTQALAGRRAPVFSLRLSPGDRAYIESAMVEDRHQHGVHGTWAKRGLGEWIVAAALTRAMQVLAKAKGTKGRAS